MYLSHFKAIIHTLHKAQKCPASSNWVSWLKHTKSKSPEEIYNRLQYPAMLDWLLSVIDLKRDCEIRIEKFKTSEIRALYPWKEVRKALIEFNNNKTDNEMITYALSFTEDIDVNELQRYLEAQKWRTSVNPYMRHQYIYRERVVREKVYTKEELEVLNEIAEYVHQNGIDEEWRGKIYSYFYLGRYKYWVMWKTERRMASVNRWYR